VPSGPQAVTRSSRSIRARTRSSASTPSTPDSPVPWQRHPPPSG
jgi:hypothetical protein